MSDFEDSIQWLVDYAENRINEHAEKRREKGLNDVLYAFALSESGEIYEGKPFESSQPSFNFCAERHAINEMQYRESEEAELKAVLVAGPVPGENQGTTKPCGACRHAINQFGTEDTKVIATNFVRLRDGSWNIFPKIQKYEINQLYPEAYEPVEWE